MSVRELVRNNPWKTLIGSVSVGSVIITIVGSVFTEFRYVNKSELKETTARIEELEKKIIEITKK
jgi:hypothetical protein